MPESFFLLFDDYPLLHSRAPVNWSQVVSFLLVLFYVNKYVNMYFDVINISNLCEANDFSRY